MESLRFTLNRELKPNSTINLPDEIITELIKQGVGSGSHITLKDSTETEYDCLVNKIGAGFVFRILETIFQR